MIVTIVHCNAGDNGAQWQGDKYWCGQRQLEAASLGGGRGWLTRAGRGQASVG